MSAAPSRADDGRRLWSLAKRGSPLADPRAQVERLRAASLPDEAAGGFDGRLEAAGLAPLTADAAQILQLNVGKRCNQACSHCHVDAAPDRVESMTDAVVERCFELIASGAFTTLDLTAGAPELHPRFRELVAAGRAARLEVIDRCNLTVLAGPGGADMARFLAEHRVLIVASLPHPRARLTDQQRGDGVFERSLIGLRHLAAAGYGAGRGLTLVLVANPVGTLLPGAQEGLEREWRRELEQRHGLAFDALWALVNMPIGRFLDSLDRAGRTDAYLATLARAFNPAAVAALMCRNTLSVGWDGRLYDCDFNQQLELDVTLADGTRPTVFDLDPARLAGRRIRTAPHCFGCTAGAGSSCGGSLA